MLAFTTPKEEEPDSAIGHSCGPLTFPHIHTNIHGITTEVKSIDKVIRRNQLAVVSKSARRNPGILNISGNLWETGCVIFVRDIAKEF